MNEDEDLSEIDEAQEQADFGAGFSGVESKTPAKPEKPEPAREAPRAEEEPKPEFIQVTAKQWAEVEAAARRTASYDSQFSKAFGTIGNLQKLVNGFQTQAQPPAGKKFEIPKEAFAAMRRDFPELADQTEAALVAALSGMGGTAGAEVDATKIEAMLATYTGKREIEALEDAYPTWREIVGAVDTTREQPNPDNPFRKWLATKDATYQARINNSESAAVIGRAIRTFQDETKKAPVAKPAVAVPTPRDAVQADRIRAAVKPRGDNAVASAGKSDEEEFASGFANARG